MYGNWLSNQWGARVPQKHLSSVGLSTGVSGARKHRYILGGGVGERVSITH